VHDQLVGQGDAEGNGQQRDHNDQSPGRLKGVEHGGADGQQRDGMNTGCEGEHGCNEAGTAQEAEISSPAVVER
jgi:hypothetical protein